MVIGIKGNQSRNYMQREERLHNLVLLIYSPRRARKSSQDQKFNFTFKIQITFNLSERGVLVLRED